MTIEWKKISEHPLPEGDGKKIYLIKRDGFLPPTFCTFQPEIYIGKNYTHWAEINPPEEDKEPEVELWDVVKDEKGRIGVVVGCGSKGEIEVWDIKEQRRGYWFHSYITCPDLEALAPAIIKSDSAKSGYVLDTSMYSKDVLNMSSRNLRQWPSSLSAMIVVQKGGV